MTDLNTLIAELNELRDRYGGVTPVGVMTDGDPLPVRFVVEPPEANWPGIGLGGPVVLIDATTPDEEQVWISDDNPTGE